MNQRTRVAAVRSVGASTVRKWHPGTTAGAVVRELRSTLQLCAGVRSKVRLSADVVLFRALRMMRLPNEGRRRSVRLRDGTTITYRLNRGDIQSIREVFMDEAYRPPFDCRPDVVIDLGANIGLTSLYWYRTLAPRLVIAVEPDPENARIARINLGGIPATVIEKAVGARDGTAKFQQTRTSNQGSLSRDGVGVDVVVASMATVLAEVPLGLTVLVKVDIEGGEQDLFASNTEWLERIDGLVVEFHPDLVDYPGLVNILQQTGFTYVPAGSRWPDSMDAFYRVASDD